jgi:glycosyltransferase involved in cell wall biosynthesis
MKILIDMQGVQSESRQRGIGRYTLSFTNGLIRVNSSHEIILLFNGLFPDSVEWARSYFAGKLSQKNICVWMAPGQIGYINENNTWHRKVAELIREASILSLNPDIVLISSIFEGIGDNVATSIDKFTHDLRTAVIVYDLIPLINKEDYLPNERVEKWYMEKFAYLEKANICLAISESTRQEILSHTRISPHKVTNISSACDEIFSNNSTNVKLIKETHAKFGIIKPFVMYVGGVDVRKNYQRLFSAYSKLPKLIRDNHQLVIVVGGMSREFEILLKKQAKKLGLMSADTLFVTNIDDLQLIALYQSCKVFVFPSWHEGFGLPVLEAMSCGAAVIGSETSNIPEVIGYPEALFNPFNDEDISEKIHKVLTDEYFRQKLIKHGLSQCKFFSWDLTAKRALSAFEEFIKSEAVKSPAKFDRSNPLSSKEIVSRLIESIIALPNFKKDEQSFVRLAETINSSVADDTR